MTTTTLHLQTQRSRFAQHALATLAMLVPPLFRGPPPVAQLRADTTDVAPEAAAREAQAVRELASSYAKTDPGFAADLYAAAARHESLHEV